MRNIGVRRRAKPELAMAGATVASATALVEAWERKEPATHTLVTERPADRSRD